VPCSSLSSVSSSYPLLDIRTLFDNTIFEDKINGCSAIRFRFTLFKKSKVCRIMQTNIVGKEQISKEIAKGNKTTERKKKTVLENGASESSQENILRSVKRSKKLLLEKSLLIGVDRMLTLTFQDNVVDLDQANIAFERFCRLMRKKGDFKYVAVPERQKRGAIHYHLGLTKFYEVFKVLAAWRLAIKQTIGSVGALIGGVFINKSASNKFNKSGSLGIAKYISKYIGKGFNNAQSQPGSNNTANSLFKAGDKRFYSSKNEEKSINIVLFTGYICDGGIIDNCLLEIMQKINKLFDFKHEKKGFWIFQDKFEFKNWCFQDSIQRYFVF
jgi:hypothetical protein